MGCLELGDVVMYWGGRAAITGLPADNGGICLLKWLSPAGGLGGPELPAPPQELKRVRGAQKVFERGGAQPAERAADADNTTPLPAPRDSPEAKAGPKRARREAPAAAGAGEPRFAVGATAYLKGYPVKVLQVPTPGSSIYQVAFVRGSSTGSSTTAKEWQLCSSPGEYAQRPPGEPEFEVLQPVPKLPRPAPPPELSDAESSSGGDAAPPAPAAAAPRAAAAAADDDDDVVVQPKRRRPRRARAPAAAAAAAAPPAESSSSESESEEAPEGSFAAQVKAQRQKNAEFLNSLGLEDFKQPKAAPRPRKAPKRPRKQESDDEGKVWYTSPRYTPEAIAAREAQRTSIFDTPAPAEPEYELIRGDLPQAKADQSDYLDSLQRGSAPPARALPAGPPVSSAAQLAKFHMRGHYRLTKERVFSLALHATEPLAACGSVAGGVGIVNLATHETVRAQVFNHATRSVVFQLGSTAVLGCTDDGLLRRLPEDRETWEEIIFSKDDSMEGIAQPFGSPECLWVATTDGEVIQGDLRKDGKVTGRFTASDSRIYGVDAHPSDPNRLMTFGVRGEVKVWDVRNGMGRKSCVSEMAHERAAGSAVFSPSGQRVLTSSWDNTVKLWDITSHKAKQLGSWSHYNMTGRFLTKLAARFLPGSEEVIAIGSRGQNATPKGAIDIHDFGKRQTTCARPDNAENSTVNSLVEIHQRLPLMVSTFSSGLLGIWY